MNRLDRASLSEFANEGIARFHKARLARLAKISLQHVLKKKNPYLFRAKNLLTASELIKALLDAFLSSSEEELFGKFLEELVIFVSQHTSGGRKSSAKGLDLEFDRDSVRYLVAIKSGPNWGNSSQWANLEQNFKTAIRVQRQVDSNLSIQAIVGSCYGKTKTRDRGFFKILVGQIFWHFLSDDAELYLDIIEPIGHRAREHNDDFIERRAALENRFTMELIQDFCNPDYTIDWRKLVVFNSSNL